MCVWRGVGGGMSTDVVSKGRDVELIEMNQHRGQLVLDRAGSLGDWGHCSVSQSIFGAHCVWS